MERKEEQPRTKGLLVELGLQIRRQRKRQGWSRKLLASKLGVTENCLGRWERGERLPRPPTLIRMMAVCGVLLKGHNVSVPRTARKTRKGGTR